MRILAVSDEVAPQIYDEAVKRRFPGVELVLGCGDVPLDYLDFIVSALDVPLYYVMGNHGPVARATSGQPGGITLGACQDIDERVVEIGGLLIAGLQGSMRYKPGPYQYSQREMQAKVLRLGFKVLHARWIRKRPLDILITHAPPFAIHDGHDLCHTGFQALLRFMDRHRPRFLLHGHSHVYSQLQTVTTQYGQTMVMNVHPYRLIDVPPIRTEEIN